MFSGTSHSYAAQSYNLQSSSVHDRNRPVGLSSPQTAVHNLSASHTAGMAPYHWSSSTTGPSAGGGYSSGQVLADSLSSQSRPQYQPGYLLSLSQAQSAQPNGTRFEESHLIPTRAKMNPAFPRNSPDFGSESLFDSTKHRHREQLDDEDGPPTSTVNDIVTEVYPSTFSSRTKPPPAFPTPVRGIPSNRISIASPAPTSQNQTLHIIVYGYPPSRWSSTVAHFQSIADGGTTEPEALSDVENAFKIGYKQPWEAARAVRRNGETISGDGGRWMVGVKWADPHAAEQILGVGARPSLSSTPISINNSAPFAHDDMDTSPDPAFSQLQRINTAPAPTIGTPIKLAPSASVFKKSGGGDAGAKSAGPGVGGLVPGAAPVVGTGTQSPAKGVFGQFSELVFGW